MGHEILSPGGAEDKKVLAREMSAHFLKSWVAAGGNDQPQGAAREKDKYILIQCNKQSESVFKD